MKNLKKLKSETSEILNEIQKTHYDEFTQINEYQMKLQEYYDENDKNVDNETLLQMYKHIKKKKKGLSDNMTSVFNGVFGGAIVTTIFELSGDDEKTNPIVIFIASIIIISFLIISAIVYIINVTRHDDSYRMCFFDKVHSNILEKLIKERDFCLFRGDKE